MRVCVNIKALNYYATNQTCLNTGLVFFWLTTFFCGEKKERKKERNKLSLCHSHLCLCVCISSLINSPLLIFHPLRETLLHPQTPFVPRIYGMPSSSSVVAAEHKCVTTKCLPITECCETSHRIMGPAGVLKRLTVDSITALRREASQ